MRLGIMQPYFFPYLGYYSLIKNSDKWIVFDTVQFIRHGWIERNRVLKPSDGWQYISVPLEKHSRQAAIKDVLIRNEPWRDKIFRQLEHYKKAPYYTKAFEVIRSALDNDFVSIVDLNSYILAQTCSYLEIPFNYQILSKMDLEIEPVSHPGQWALNICKALKATQYINPHGGVDIFDISEFTSCNINISFLKHRLPEYSQRRKVFEPGLSIVDVMMFNDPKAIQQMLDQYDCV